MKEYKCYECEEEAEGTEIKLNEFAKEGWRVICSYSNYNYWLILERDKKRWLK